MAVPGRLARTGGSRRRQRREALAGLLASRDWPALRGRAASDLQTVATLVSLLQERDDLLRWRAIEGLGEVCAARAVLELETVRDLVRRQLWAMNDESGNIAWHAAEAVGEILCRVPPLADEFAENLASHAEQDLFRAGVCWALGRLAAARPELVRGQLPLLLGALADASPMVRACAALAVGRLGEPADSLEPPASEVTSALERLFDDGAVVPIYDLERGEIEERTVGALARAALEARAQEG